MGVARGTVSSKVCPACKTEKPATEFHLARGTATGLASYCKPCAWRKVQEWRQRNPERARAIDRRWSEFKGKRWKLARRYGMTLEQYDAMVATQDGRCALCRQPETTRQGDGIRPLSVDHDHITGRVRGLLCHRCNSALDHLVASPEILRNLPSYLQ